MPPPPEKADVKPPLAVIVGTSQTTLKGEDTVFYMEEVMVAGESCSFTVVADGHGGKTASTYISTHMLARIVSAATGAGALELDKAARTAFAQIHDEVCNMDTNAGSTCTVCCINATRQEVSTWNVGDSLAMMVYDGGYRELGQTHRLEDSPLEQERVKKTGAQLGRAVGNSGKPGGPLRAYPGGLAVVRCIGDSDCTQFVTPEPAFSTCPAPPQGGAVIACSDGIWDHLQAEDAAVCILAGGFEGGESAAACLVQAAISKSPHKAPTDDMSAAILIFGPKPHSDDAKSNPFVASFRNGSRRASRPGSPEVGFGKSVTVLARENSWALNPKDSQTTKDLQAAAESFRLKRRDGASVKGGVVFAEFAEQWLLPKGETSEDNSGGSDSGTGSNKGQRKSKGAAASPARKAMGLMRRGRRAAQWDPADHLGRSSKGGFATMFDAIVNNQGSPTASPNMDGSRKKNRFQRRMDASDEDDGMSASSGSCAAKMDLPWQGQGVNGDGLTNMSPDGQGWVRHRMPLLSMDGLPLPEPGVDPSQSADEDLLGNYTRVHGSRTPARVIKWGALGSLQFLGEGEFATAHATQLEDETVAVKMLKPQKAKDETAVSGLKREIMLMTLMVHPNVLRASAIGEHEEKPFMVLSVLTSVLSNDLPQSADNVPFWTRRAEVKRWPLTRALRCGVQLARAIKYCHDDAFPGYRIIHRDIKPNNIGFVGPDQLVLFDFGLASLWKHGDTSTDDKPRMLTGETGSLRYMAPEVAMSMPYSHRAEAFSFATILWEMAAHQRPYGQFHSEGPFKAALASGTVPDVNAKWPEELKSILADCWQLDEGARPEFHSTLPRLENLQASLLDEQEAKNGGKKNAKKSERGVAQAGGAFSC